MSVIPESEWQKKFNKTSSQDTTETWQNKFKKPSWQRELGIWTDRCVKQQSLTDTSEYVYKPINKSYHFKQFPAYLMVEGIGALGGSYFFKGSIFLKEDGSLSVSAQGMTPASSFPQATVVWEMTAEVIVNGKTILKKDFHIPKEVSAWAGDFTIIGEVKFKLPEPHFYNKVVLILEGTYRYDTNTGFVQPEPQRKSKAFSLDIIKKRRKKIPMDKKKFDKIFNQSNPIQF